MHIFNETNELFKNNGNFLKKHIKKFDNKLRQKWYFFYKILNFYATLGNL